MKALFNDGHVDEIPKDEELHVIRHSAAHILAQAVKRLYPEADFAYGPATDNGFYYDIELPEGTKLSEEDFPAIEAEMRKIVRENLKFETYELPREQAISHMAERGEKYKVEHIDDLPEDARITFYKQGEYVDMCVGPHILYTKALKAFKLTGVSGAYWKGDKNNKMLTRVNGIAFRNKEELAEHERLLAEIPMGAAWSKVSVAATIPATLRPRPMAVMMCCVRHDYLPCHRMLPYCHYTHIILIILINQYNLEFLWWKGWEPSGQPPLSHLSWSPPHP